MTKVGSALTLTSLRAKEFYGEGYGEGVRPDKLGPSVRNAAVINCPLKGNIMNRKGSEKTAEDRVFIVTLIFTGVDKDSLERYLKTIFKDLIPESIEVEEFGNPYQVTVIVPERLPAPGDSPTSPLAREAGSS